MPEPVGNYLKRSGPAWRERRTSCGVCITEETATSDPASNPGSMLATAVCHVGAARHPCVATERFFGNAIGRWHDGRCNWNCGVNCSTNEFVCYLPLPSFKFSFLKNCSPSHVGCGQNQWRPGYSYQTRSGRIL